MRIFTCFLVFSVFLLCVSVVVCGPSASQLLDAPVPPPPHHQRDLAQTADDIELAQHAHSFDQEQQHILLESETRQHSALDLDVEPQVSVPLSPEDAALIGTEIRLPALDDGIPVRYMNPPLSFNIDNDKQDKLQNALNTVVNVAKGKMDEIKKEKEWSNKVQKLIKELSEKKLKVENHLNTVSEEIRKVFTKKKKIQNAILQRKLAAKLKQTHRNLKRVRRYAYGLSRQELLYNKHKEELSHAVENLTRSIALLKGIHRKKKYDLPKPGTAEKLLEGHSKLDPDFSSDAQAEADEVARLTDFSGKQR